MTELDPRYAATAGLEMALDLPAARQGAARVRAHAEEPANVYIPGLAAGVGNRRGGAYHGASPTWTPGQDEHHVFESGSHRVVYSITKDLDAGTLYRHMSISLIGAAPGKLPAAPAVFTVATYLGFTRGQSTNGITVLPGDDWSMEAQVREDGSAIVVVVQVFEGGA